MNRKKFFWPLKETIAQRVFGLLGVSVETRILFGFIWRCRYGKRRRKVRSGLPFWEGQEEWNMQRFEAWEFSRDPNYRWEGQCGWGWAGLGLSRGELGRGEEPGCEGLPSTRRSWTCPTGDKEPLNVSCQVCWHASLQPSLRSPTLTECTASVCMCRQPDKHLNLKTIFSFHILCPHSSDFVLIRSALPEIWKSPNVSLVIYHSSCSHTLLPLVNFAGLLMAWCPFTQSFPSLQIYLLY